MNRFQEDNRVLFLILDVDCMMITDQSILRDMSIHSILSDINVKNVPQKKFDIFVRVEMKFL